MEFFYSHPVALIFGVAAAVIALAFYFSWRRRKDLEQLSASMGLSFEAAGPSAQELEATGLEIFRLGHSRKASNLIRASAGSAGLSLFDYRYTVGGGKSSHTHQFTLALISGAKAEVPRFELKPETFLYKIGEAIGFKDIDLPAFPEFSDKYRLTGPDEAAVHMFFTPRRASWFERNLGLQVQGAPGHAVFFRREGALPADSWQALLEDARVFEQEVLR